jgi:hypothetical protein
MQSEKWPVGDGSMYRSDAGYLDMTIMSRSHDIIWGAYGANAVHFSFLQEYIAARLGVSVGKMYQFSNNWHAYQSTLDKINPRPLSRLVDPYMERPDGYPTRVLPLPVVTVPGSFVRDCIAFCAHDIGEVFANEWFHTVAQPVIETHRLWRSGRRDQAAVHADSIQALDWRIACQRWMSRRIK